VTDSYSYGFSIEAGLRTDVFHWSKGAAMYSAGSQLLQGLQMCCCAIAFIRCKTISGMILIEFNHKLVTSHLSHDGGTGDGEAKSITFDNMFLWQLYRW